MQVTVISSINTINGKKISPQHTYTIAMFNTQLNRVTGHTDHKYRKLFINGVDREFLVEETLTDQQAIELFNRL